MWMALLAALGCHRDPDGPTPADSGTPTDDSGTPGREVEPGIYLLDGLDRALPPDDLAPVVATIGDASYVGLGESVHTTGSQHAIRVRLIEALVAREGFRSITLETPWEDALAVTRYVEDGEGDAATALRGGIFGVFQSVEMLELVEWLRAWNVDHPADPVTFWGWDIQQPWDDGRLLRAFFDQWAPAEADALYAGIDPCQGVGYDDALAYYSSSEAADTLAGNWDPAAHAACETGLAAVDAWLDAHGPEVVAGGGEDALTLARLDHLGLSAWEAEITALATDLASAYAVRDAANAVVLPGLHDLWWPGTKTVVWAHDAHISKARSTVHGFDSDPTILLEDQGWISMGERLAADLGDDYRAIGTTSYVTHIDRGSYPDPPAPNAPEAVERQLHTFRFDLAYVDLHDPDVRFSSSQEWNFNHEWSTLPDDFDGFLYVDTSEAMVYIE